MDYDVGQPFSDGTYRPVFHTIGQNRKDNRTERHRTSERDRCDSETHKRRFVHVAISVQNYRAHIPYNVPTSATRNVRFARKTKRRTIKHRRRG